MADTIIFNTGSVHTSRAENKSSTNTQTPCTTHRTGNTMDLGLQVQSAGPAEDTGPFNLPWDPTQNTCKGSLFLPLLASTRWPCGASSANAALPWHTGEGRAGVPGHSSPQGTYSHVKTGRRGLHLGMVPESQGQGRAPEGSLWWRQQQPGFLQPSSLWSSERRCQDIRASNSEGRGLYSNWAQVPSKLSGLVRLHSLRNAAPLVHGELRNIREGPH